MKRILVLLIALLALVPVARAEGNRLLTLEDENYISGMFACGDTLYIAADTKLYTWRDGEDAPTIWEAGEISLDVEDGAEVVCGLYEFKLFADGDGLHGVRVGYDADFLPEKLVLCDLTLADGALKAAQAAELALPEALCADAYPSAVCMYDGRLYLVCDGENGNSITVIDPEAPMKAEATPLDGWECALLPSKDGVLLTWFDFSGSDGGNTVISRVSSNGSLDELCRLPAEAVGIATDAETGAVYAVFNGRVRPVDITTGELGEAIGALPVQPRFGAVLLHSYAADISGEVAVLDTAGRLDESAVLAISVSGYDDWLNRAVVAYSVEHPEVTPVLGNLYSNVLEAMMTKSSDADIYILSGWDSATYDALLDRGYMAPLDDREALADLAGRIYPNFLKNLTYGGALVALPVTLSGGGMGMSRTLLEKLGIAADSIPGDWPGFIDFMEDTLKPKLDLLGERDQFAYDGMYAQDFSYFLRQRALDDFLQASAAAGVIPNYEDPRLVAVLERLEQIDFTDYGLPQKPESEDDMGSSYGWSSDIHYLVQFDTSYFFDDMRTDAQPLPLGFGDDLPGVLTVRMGAAFVNPYSARRAQAVDFLEALSRRLPDELMYALCPDLSEPVRRPEADEEIAAYETQIEMIRKQVDEAEPADKQMLQQRAEDFLAQYEDYRQNGCWLISREQLAWYRANAGSLAVATPSWFEKDSTGEAYQLLEQYNAGQLSAREFLSSVNRKARMQAMEDG